MKLKKLVVGVLAFCIVGGAVPFSSAVSIPDCAITASAASYDPNLKLGVPYEDENGIWHVDIMGCKNKSLTSITIPDCFESGISNDHPVYVHKIADNAFKGCNKLRTVTIEEDLEIIGNSAFEGCSSLTSMTIPESVTSIGANAFKNCTSLASITILNSSCEIYDSADTISPSATMYVTPSSKALEYAKKYNRNFEFILKKADLVESNLKIDFKKFSNVFQYAGTKNK